MRKISLTILFILIITLSILLKFKLDNKVILPKEALSFQEYNLELPSYTIIDSYVYEDKIYTLYENNNDYLLKEINTLTNKEISYINKDAKSCRIMKVYDAYIKCETGNFTLNFIKTDITTSSETLPFETGTYKLDKQKISINDFLNNEYKEYNINLNIDKLALSANLYYAYILTYNDIYVYNLNDKKTDYIIDISKVKEDIEDMTINNSKLYILTKNIIYSYDISDYERSTNLNKENSYLSKKLSNIEDTYGIKVKFTNDLNVLHSDYNISGTTNYNDINIALSYLEDYLINFDKRFFANFQEYGMTGLSIYFVSDINGTKNGYETSDVVGLSYKKGSDYIIIAKIDTLENMTNILAHETMHIIDIFYEVSGINTDVWDSLNPSDFTYSHVYNPGMVYKDTLNSTGNKNDFYFVDSYGRSSKKEDRARIFEALIMKEYYLEYPHLKEKVNYLKEELLSNFS